MIQANTRDEREKERRGREGKREMERDKAGTEGGK